ncbi:MAG: hypothetical protein ACREP6_01280 [Candidatus Binataceae bacterium]
MPVEQPERSEQAERYEESVAENWRQFVNEKPLVVLGVATAVGFVFGGGAGTKLGLAMMMFAGRVMARRAAINFAAGVINQDGGRTRTGEDRP